ncbi:MAG: histidine kinase [Bryobacteraceae bacterium]|jgi:two-component system, LytTR family, sensor histidine kinase AlgZ
MHPLLVSGAALAIYMAGWVPLAALLIYVLEASGSLGWEASAAIVLPACLVYAFVCLSPWYVVRMTPLRAGSVVRILTTNFGAAIGGSILLLAVARGMAVLLSRFSPFPDVDQRFRPHAPLVFGMGVLLYLLSAGMHYAMASAEESKEALNREMQALVTARDAELKALKAQINPHFLFNSLNSISALAGIDAARAREMCVMLSDFLRSSLRMGERENVPLREELALAQNYLGVEQVRFGGRLRVEREIAADCEESLVPPLLLQPLVENAVKHGIASMVDGGAVRLSAWRRENALHLRVENPFDAEGSTARRNGLGLQIVKRRLLARYGDRADMAITTGENHYRVEILLPFETA